MIHTSTLESKVGQLGEKKVGQLGEKETKGRTVKGKKRSDS